MEGHMKKMSILLFLLLATATTTLVLGQGTRVGFYSSSCPLAESIVQSAVRSHFQADPRIAPGLLRMHFHDCFVQGCDASLLIEGQNTEKSALPNRGLRGYEVIDDAKTQLEQACPGVVSCADILALAARDAVVLTNGPNWSVPTGRRDGRSSSSDFSLPSIADSVDVQKQKFAVKGLNTQDLVALVGGHTIGTTACAFVRSALKNSSSSGGAEPFCPPNDASKRVALDTGSETRFDTSYFSNLQNGRGILESDQSLWNDDSTKNVVQRFLGIRGLASLTFTEEFTRSMVKMSNIEVKIGTAGEIRRLCSAVN